MKKVWEVIVADKGGNQIDSVYFDSMKAAHAFKPSTGHVTCVCEWRVFNYKDIVK